MAFRFSKIYLISYFPGYLRKFYGSLRPIIYLTILVSHLAGTLPDKEVSEVRSQAVRDTLGTKAIPKAAFFNLGLSSICA